MADDAARQDAMLTLELYQRQLEAAGRQVEFLQGVLDDVTRAKKALEGLSQEKSNEILIPLGASTFVHGTVKDKERVITGIGAGYATERTRDDALARLTEREAQVQQELDRLMQAVFQMQQEAAQLQDRLEAGPGE